MIVMNYVAPDVVIYADRLITGEVLVYNNLGVVILSRKVKDLSLINIPIDLLKNKSVKVILKTKNQSIKKIFKNL